MIDIDEIRQLRREIREEENSAMNYPVEGEGAGACGIVAEEIEMKYGFLHEVGKLVTLSGEVIHDHWWNVLPDGSILDATADQFGMDWPGDVLVIELDDPRHDNYVPYQAGEFIP